MNYSDGAELRGMIGRELAWYGSIDIVGLLCASFSCRLEQATIEACSARLGRYQETQVVTRIQLAAR
jgi:hypothetical protein